MKLADVAKALRVEVAGDGGLDVTRLVHPADGALPSDLALALTPDTAETLAETRAGAAVVRAGAKFPDGVATIVYAGHERMALAVLTRLFDPGPTYQPGVDPRAVVAPDVTMGANASIGALAVIGARSKIGTGTKILPGATVGADVVIGRDCTIHPGVRIGDRVRLGDRVVIQPNAVIGSDGFSFIPVRNPDGTRNPIDAPLRIHSVGNVVIEDDVEIGAATTIDRATLRETRIGRGSKIDNQVQIAHNVTVGEAALICGMVGLAGSVVVGDRALLGAAAGVADHLTIGADATVGASAGVGSNVAPGALVSGTPAIAHATTMERYMNIARLRMLYPKVDDLKKRVEALEKGVEGA